MPVWRQIFESIEFSLVKSGIGVYVGVQQTRGAWG